MEEEALEKVDINKWLSRLRDYVHIKPIVPVPEKVSGNAIFRNFKTKGSKEKAGKTTCQTKRGIISTGIVTL